MATKQPDVINTPLPEEMIKVRDVSRAESTEIIKSFLTQTIPTSDRKNLNVDLKWQFILEQHSVIRQKKRKTKKTFLTRKQRKNMGLLKLPKDGWKYEALQPMRTLWVEYMRENLDLIKKAPTCVDQEWNSFSVIVAKSEMVGAELKVVKSKVPSLVGMHGTVVLETKMTFQIVTPDDTLKTILKETSVFQFILDRMKFTFLGKYLTTRPSDRSVRKVKNLMNPDL